MCGDAMTVAPAVAGSDAVVNTVGHYVERGGASFEAIHGEGARHVATAAAAAGVRRLVHISGIGADPASALALCARPCPRRAPGPRGLSRRHHPAPERDVRPGDFLARLAALARVLPAIPLFGAGTVRLQPVYVEDVAAAVARALTPPVAPGPATSSAGRGATATGR